MTTANAPQVSLSWSAAVHCDGCHLSEVQKKLKFKRCGSCHTVWYCGVECQRKEWSSHKPECLRLKTRTNPTSVTSQVNEEAQCKKQEDTPAVRTTQRRLNNLVHNMAYDGGEEVEGEDVSDVEDDDSYQPIIDTDSTVTDLSNLINQLRLNSATRSRGADVLPWMAGMNSSSPVDEDRLLQMAIQASIKEEEERLKREEHQKKLEEERRRKDEEIQKAQDEIQEFYQRSLAKSREGTRELTEGQEKTENGADDKLENAYDEDDLLYSDNEDEFSDFDDADEEDEECSEPEGED